MEKNDGIAEIPNSSSHCVIGALVGVAIGDALLRSRSLHQGVDWHQVFTVLKALALSPVLGLVGAGGLYWLLLATVKRGHLFEPPKEGEPPVWWLRGLLILTCSGVSFAHGSNDGQKSIGLIMLTIIGLMPAVYALNPDAGPELARIGVNAQAAIPIIQQYGDDLKEQGVRSAQQLQSADLRTAVAKQGAGASKETRAQLRGDIYDVLGQLKHAEEASDAPKDVQAQAAKLRKEMGPPVHYAPVWVRMLSALCLGVGTMVGYKRIVRTLGERLGKQHMTPGQGASAELVGAVLIGVAGFSGLPVSTTHVVTSGIAGTMIAGGQGVQRGMIIRIVLAWVFTLPATIAAAAGLFYLLNNPSF